MKLIIDIPDNAYEHIIEHWEGNNDECEAIWAIRKGKPIVYGEWVHREELFDDEEKPRMVWGCKKCGFSLKSTHDKRNFCPNCGAKMKESEEEEGVIVQIVFITRFVEMKELTIPL